jgi:hypothetical protein
LDQGFRCHPAIERHRVVRLQGFSSVAR